MCVVTVVMLWPAWYTLHVLHTRPCSPLPVSSILRFSGALIAVETGAAITPCSIYGIGFNNNESIIVFLNVFNVYEVWRDVIRVSIRPACSRRRSVSAHEGSGVIV